MNTKISDFNCRINDYLLEIHRRENHLVNTINAKLQHNSVKAYWYEEVINFGDLITPLLLQTFGFSPLHAPKQEANFLGIGSILQDITENFSGFIAGSGLIHDKKMSLPHAKILALRGSLTRDRLDAPKNTVLGDPGLLVEKFKYHRQDKKYLIGLIPHFVDKKDQRIHLLQKRYHNDIFIINVQRYPKEVIQEIDRCEYVLSSSLHGLVTADALGIPNGWFRCKGETLGTFKFFDYASALNKELSPYGLTGSEKIDDLLQMTRSVPSEIDEVKYNLDQVFLSLRNLI